LTLSRCSSWSLSPQQQQPTTRTEVSETDKDVSITVELPRVAPENVEVSLDDDVLTLRAATGSENKADADKNQNRDFSLMSVSTDA
jgi:HSP20 family molecular chaperone IbpA